MSAKIHTYIELREPIYDGPSVWKRDATSQRPPSFHTPVKQLAATIVALALIFWLWFDVSTYHAPQASYPYYDTQKPVPPWSEPMPLKGNHDRGEEYR